MSKSGFCCNANDVDRTNEVYILKDTGRFAFHNWETPQVDQPKVAKTERTSRSQVVRGSKVSSDDAVTKEETQRKMREYKEAMKQAQQEKRAELRQKRQAQKAEKQEQEAKKKQEAAEKKAAQKAAAEKAKQEKQKRDAEEKARKEEEARIAAEKARIEKEKRDTEEKARREEEERIAAEKEKARKEEEERLAAEKAKREEEERIAAEKARKEEEARIAAEKKASALAKKAEEARLAAAKKAEEARLAAEKKKKEEEERRAAEKARKEEEARIAAEKAAAEKARKEEEARIAAEKAAAEKARKEEEARIAAEKAAAEKARREEEERIAAEKAAAEKARREEEERIAAEKARIEEEARKRIVEFEENSEHIIYRNKSAQNACDKGEIKSKHRKYETELTLTNYSSKQYVLLWVNANGKMIKQGDIEIGDTVNKNLFATNPLVLQHSEGVTAVVIMKMKPRLGRTFYLVDQISGLTDFTIQPYYVQDGFCLQENEQSTNVKAIASKKPIKLTFTNESSADVKLNWIDFEGNQQTYAKMTPGATEEQDTFITHPWAFVVNGEVKQVLTILSSKCQKTNFTITDGANGSICIE